MKNNGRKYVGNKTNGRKKNKDIQVIISLSSLAPFPSPWSGSNVHGIASFVGFFFFNWVPQPYMLARV